MEHGNHDYDNRNYVILYKIVQNERRIKMKSHLDLHLQIKKVIIWFDFGWFSGSEFSLFEFNVLDFFAKNAVELFGVKIAKFYIGVGIDW